MRPGEELVESDEIAQRLAHLLSVDGNHVVVHPVAHSVGSVVGHALGYLALVVRELQVHAAAVDVEHTAEVLFAHRGTFEMPPRKTLAPWRGPVHYMLRRGFFPKSEVGGVAFFALSVEFSRGRQQFVDVASRQASVAMGGVELGHIEINRAVAFVGIACIENRLYVLYLLNNMA